MLLKLLSVFSAAISYALHRNVFKAAITFVITSIVFSPLIIHLIPRKACSKLMGRIMKIKLGPLTPSAIRLYMKATKVNPETVSAPITNYKSIQQFFNRDIDLEKRGLTKLNNKFQISNPLQNAIYVPADSKLAHQGYFTPNEHITAKVKGIDFTAEQLLQLDAKPQYKMHFSVFYLSPADYHTYHVPFDFKLEHINYVPGDLWPVNTKFMGRINGLLAVNERVVLSGKWGTRRAFVVPVGALNVGSIHLFGFQINPGQKFNTPYEYVAGQPLGNFSFGSTVVLAFEVEENEVVTMVGDKVQVGAIAGMIK
ncbi:Phosphatidylserine_decarboxylase proenzyme [Hexamita inflata]|uniref:phosphatidylserine decarboxylase n=1 Tax=Hexamita inflata TaxID=28002 RepID=A0AA86P8I9_9EUKA|nr:Phosphatidylserine decarboxylase proenzyme [Hexamita inflata]